MTQTAAHTSEFFEILKKLLHPDDRILLAKFSNELVVETFSLSQGDKLSEFPVLDDHVTVINNGVIGVSHRFDDLSNWSHFYTKGDLIFNLEVHEELNEMDTTWHVLEETELYSINTKVSDQHPLKNLMTAFRVQRSLLCSYQYQHYIKIHGLDRHEYSVHWIEENARIASKLPRKELANFLGISNSSLKIYMREAIKNAKNED